MTLFIDSIQIVSKSPSSKIHLGFWSGIYPRERILLDKSPSFHYLEGVL